MAIPKSIIRFARYVRVGVISFAFDLSVLYLLTTGLHVPYYLSTPVAFLIATSGNYMANRVLTFPGTARSWHGGYAYFIAMSLVGAAVTTLGVVALVTLLRLPYLAARVLVAGLVGFGNYLFNLHINFRVAGFHLDSKNEQDVVES